MEPNLKGYVVRNRLLLIGVVTVGILAVGAAGWYLLDRPRPAGPASDIVAEPETKAGFPPTMPEPDPQPRAAPPFTTPAGGSLDLVAPDPAVAPALPPAAVPTLSPTQRVGDRKLFGPHPAGPLASSRDGKTIAFSTGAGGGSPTQGQRRQGVAVWSTADSRVVRMRVNLAANVEQVALSPSGDTLYAGGSAGNHPLLPLRVWDVATGRLLRERPAALWALSGDGATLATADIHVGTFDRMHADEPTVPWRFTLSLWDAPTGVLRRSFTYPSVIPTALALSADGSRVACGAQDQLLAFDAVTGKALWRSVVERDAGSGASFFALAFSPDGATLASAEQRYFPPRHALRTWDAATGAGRRLTPADGTPTSHPILAGWGFTPDSKTLVIGLGDVAAAVDVATGVWPTTGDPAVAEQREAFARGGLQPDDAVALYSFGLSGDGTTAFLGGRFRDDAAGLRVVDVASHAVRFPPTKIGLIRAAYPPADKFPLPERHQDSPAPDWMAMPERGELRWQSYVGPLQINGAKIGAGDTIGYTITPDAETLITRGQLAAVGGQKPDDPQARFWDVATRKPWGDVVGPGHGQSWCRRAMVVSPDGRTLAAMNPDRSIWLWEIATLKPRARLDTEGEDVFRFTFSRDGRFVMSNDLMGATGLVWDLAAVAAGKNPAAPDAAELVALWGDLAGDDAARAYRAVWRLASHPAATVPFLGSRAKAVPAMTDAARIAARPFDKEIVFARRLVEALELAGAESREPLRGLAGHPAFQLPASAAVRRMSVKPP